MMSKTYVGLPGQFIKTECFLNCFADSRMAHICTITLVLNSPSSPHSQSGF